MQTESVVSFTAFVLFALFGKTAAHRLSKSLRILRGQFRFYGPNLLENIVEILFGFQQKLDVLLELWPHTFQPGGAQGVTVGEHFVGFLETLQPTITGGNYKVNKGGKVRLHLLLRPNHRFHVQLIDHTGQTLHKHLGSGVVLEAFNAKITFWGPLHLLFLFIIFFEVKSLSPMSKVIVQLSLVSKIFWRHYLNNWLSKSFIINIKYKN